MFTLHVPTMATTTFVLLTYHNFCFADLPQGSTNTKLKLAEQQGAEFMVECVDIILTKPQHDEHVIYSKKPMKVKEATEAINKLLEPLGTDGKVLFHIGEHRKMCEREGDFAKAGARFSRGAMTSLAQAQNVRVVATFTEPLNSVLAQVSSTVCRLPIPLPCLDVNTLMEKVPELKFTPESLESMNQTQRALLASLKFRLGMKITHGGLLPGVLGSSEQMEKFLDNFKLKRDNFQNKATEEDRTEALRECVTACILTVTTSTTKSDNAARLLCGVPDTEIQSTGLRQAKDLVALSFSEVSASLACLLSLSDANISVFEQGRILMRQVRTSSGPNLFVDSPLERAYLWSLSCEAALTGQLEFGNWTFVFKPKKLRPERIFPTSLTDNPQTTHLRTHCFYYADEKKGSKQSHPLADLFFVTKDKELVLIDITGSAKKETVQTKVANLQSFIDGHKNKLNKYDLFGVVLAPCLPDHQASSTDKVCVVPSDQAQKQLGGLRQVFRWLVPKEQTGKRKRPTAKEQVQNNRSVRVLALLGVGLLTLAALVFFWLLLR